MNKNNQNNQAWRLFMENTKLNKRNIINFVANMEFDNSVYEPSPNVVYSPETILIPKPDDHLYKIMEARKSERKFDGKLLDLKTIGSLFSGFCQKNDGTRMLPSGGGKYPIEIFAFIFKGMGKINKKVIYYDYKKHGIVILGECSNWRLLTGKNGEWVFGEPSMLVVFVGFDQGPTSKYGDRGGRFVLIEAGHYAQNFGLRLAQEKLKGVEVGGLFDDEIKEALKLGGTDADVLLGFLCG